MGSQQQRHDKSSGRRCRRRTGRVGGKIAACLLGTLLLTCSLGACGGELPPQRIGPGRESVAAELAGDAATISARLQAFFNDGRAGSTHANRFAPDDRLHHFTAVPVRAPIGSQQVEAPNDRSLSRAAETDPALRRWLQQDNAARTHDLFLFQPTGPNWWPSEYRHGGALIPFTCNFILDLQPIGHGRTRIEVIEVMPRVSAGETSAFARHGVGVGRAHDIRPVAPTTGDRIELLERMLGALD